jgi:hypothetical protein
MAIAGLIVLSSVEMGFVSQPKVVAELIEQAATATAK